MFSSRKIYFFSGFAFLLFIVYGSLVPLDFHPRPLAAALKDFAHIRYLRLGMESRADWVANLLLYIPLSYLLLGCLMGERRFFRQTLFSLVVFGFCVTLSVGIEFTQLFFPPRTVSLNDIIAEVLGSAIGIVLWWASGHRLRRLLDLLLAQGRSAAYAGSILYAIVYLAFSLFPYDFLISAQEVHAKLARPYFHWFASAESCGSGLRCGVKLFAEVVAVAPLGFLFGLLTRLRGGRLLIVAASIGFCLGLTIEGVQFFLVSGVTLGASVFTRVIGVAGGALVGEMLAQASLWPLLYFFAPFMPLVLAVYTALLGAVTWVGKGPLLNADQGLDRLKKIYFLPFYYHYYTSESAAMASLLGIVAMFFPVGALFWVWRITRIREFAMRGAVQAGLLSASIAVALEIGKLFFAGTRPDPTNVIIASAAAAAGFLALSVCTNASLQLTSRSEEVSPMIQAVAVDPRASTFARMVRRFVALMLAAAVGVGLWRFPFAPLLLSVGSIIYCATLYRYPLAWLMVLPALLPVLDLAPWSGWFFFDELDFVVLLTVAIGLWCNEPQPRESRQLGVWLSCAIALLALSYLISLSIGLLPLQPWDANAFSSYYSRYNSARMSKSVFEALALFYIFLRQRGDDHRCAVLLVTGMVAGVASLVLAVLWEKFRFTGLMDFVSDFRVTATFSGLHNGGNDLEAYLVLAQPFIIAAMIMRRHWLANIAGTLLFVLSTYALFVTFSRAGLLALAVNGLVLSITLAVSFRRHGLALLGGGLRMAMLLGSGAAVLVALVLGGSYFQARLSATQRDWQYRVLQSQKTVELMRPDWRTSWFGMGIGSFPAVVYERNPLNNRPSAYRFEMDGNNQFVRLFPGISLYFGQWLGAVTPFEKYRLILDVRAHGPGSLSGHLCEKTLQYSFRCAHHSFGLKASEGWVEQQAEIDVQRVGSDELGLGWLSRRPVEFAFSNGSKNVVIDVDNVRLLNAAGQNLLTNGDFSRGADRWFFTVDDHTPWQNWNHGVQLFFEQGWFGVASFVFFLGCLYARMGAQVVRGHWLAAVAMAALTSFLSVGIFGFLFDTPRMALIFFFLALVFARGLAAPIGATESAQTA